MAISATIFKADLQISDMDRGYYANHNLTIARHPSETDERMMVRLIAFALNASEQIQFTKGISTDDEPDVWEKDLTGAISLWIETGLPDERRIRKACNQSKEVIVYSYGERSPAIWWDGIRKKASRFTNLKVYNLPYETTSALSQLVERTMQIQVSIQDGELWISTSEGNVTVKPEVWFPAH